MYNSEPLIQLASEDHSLNDKNEKSKIVFN